MGSYFRRGSGHGCRPCAFGLGWFDSITPHKRKKMEEIRILLEQGWTFSYEPDTNFIGANHPSGGKFSVCRMCPSMHTNEDKLGEAIAKYLNDL